MAPQFSSSFYFSFTVLFSSLNSQKLIDCRLHFFQHACHYVYEFGERNSVLKGEADFDTRFTMGVRPPPSMRLALLTWTCLTTGTILLG